MHQMGIAPPEELELALVDVVCTAVAAGAADSAADAARLLDSAQGLLATHSSRPQALLTVLLGLQHLFSAAACPAGECRKQGCRVDCCQSCSTMPHKVFCCIGRLTVACQAPTH